MSQDPKTMLLSMLPAGEWRNVQVLTALPGMMSAHNWALCAKAQWLRQGGRNSFVKFIVCAPEGAGSATNLVTGRRRLEVLEKRLITVKNLGRAVPFVPLLDVRLHDGGLLIAMEEVRPLRELIESGIAYDFSRRVLVDLDFERAVTDGLRWLHFDICPLNIGVDGANRCVLIDPDSFYLSNSRVFDVSVPAWKAARVPTAVREAVEDCGVHVPLDVAVRKMRFEVAVAAAECVLGLIPSMFPSRGLDHATVEAWLQTKDESDAGVAFWAESLRTAVACGEMPPLAELAAAFERRVETQRGSNGDLRKPADVKSPVPPLGAQPMLVAEVKQVPKTDGIAAGVLESLKPTAIALRAGRLKGDGIADYRASLEHLVRKHPQVCELWDELLHVVISHQKDSSAAVRIVDEALLALPTNREFSRLKQSVRTWALEETS